MVGPIYARRLEKLGIEKIEDLLHHIPHRYQDYRLISDISRVQIGETITLHAKVESLKNVFTNHGRRMQFAEISDSTGAMQVTWFNQIFLVRTIKKGDKYSFSGKVGWFNRKKSLVSPEYELLIDGKPTVHTGRLVPIYPETSRISSKWLRSKITFSYETLGNSISEFMPQEFLDKNSYPTLLESIRLVHFPENPEEPKVGRQRLAFNELLFHQLKSLYRKSDWRKIKTVHSLKIDKKVYEEFKNSLPFELTASQNTSIKEILTDLEKEYPMNRLLEGDVGSGKTVVAAAGSFAAFVNGFQSIFMAPTQILAQQHVSTLNHIFASFKIRISLVTSEGIKSDLGKTDIFVGTHALIHKKVKFDNVGYIVIDEQHRFGVEQRAHLVSKSGKSAGSGRRAPHVLTMTATPIPRTVALTVYGDLDLSTLDELPKGRLPITTWLVPPAKREGAYDWIKKQIGALGVQAFVICPLIEESQVETLKQVKAATTEFETLKKIFSGLEIGILHGKQTAKIKNEVLDNFKSGKTDILVATPVVEVGIDVPNATLMIIEAAERFGLAQLHQLRGRIGRGEKKSYCLMFAESRSPKVASRLKALMHNKSGFELAEIDLQLRGPGEIFGKKQHGFPELKIASWQDVELIKKSKSVAQEAIDNPKKYSELFKKLDSQNIVPN